MRPRLSSFFVSAVLAMLIASPCMRALADNAPKPAHTGSASSCGTTIDDQLAAARRALQTDDAAIRVALTCLIGATASLNERVRNDEASHTWHPPVINEPFQFGH